jgi:hypothetical protein
MTMLTKIIEKTLRKGWKLNNYQIEQHFARLNLVRISFKGMQQAF